MQPIEALKNFFGYTSFRDQQEEIINSVLAKNDTQVIMPTGGGKSMCFQIPALVSDGLAIVVSPLIALMKDQVDALKSNGISAEYINSSQGVDDQRMIAHQAKQGELKLLYISPEKLLSANFINFIASLKVSLIAIDEAHCISSWGHDFRPEYTQLKVLKETYPQIPIIALTATADEVTRRDISEQLGMISPKQFIASFDRPNISLAVKPAQKRKQQIISFIKARPQQAGIIYCLSKKETEKLSSALISEGVNAGYYHAGMPRDKREKAQDDFINDNLDVICATIAFGMGIDKPNVRWVIHNNVPKNIEGYYQEIGRGGRDGLEAEALLFYSYADTFLLRSFADESGQPELQNAKLDRMVQFAESPICRRKTLLSYFSEQLEEDCGNCDVCINPPQHFEGTVIAQKALSAIYRLKESVGITLLINILRGSKNKEILEGKYNTIKTYGVGSDISFFDWQQYIYQLINLGYIKVAYDRNYKLGLTSSSQAVLFEKKKVKLVQAKDLKEAKDKTKAPTKAKLVYDELFVRLRNLRKQLADEKGVPPYIIFNDSTLKDIVEKKPTTLHAMKEISGFGEVKIKRFGHLVSDEVFNFLSEKESQKQKVKGSTHLQTYALLERGFSVEDIAEKRGMQTTTVFSHIAQLYKTGNPIDIYKYVSKEEIKQIEEAIKEVNDEEQRLKPIFEYTKEKISYGKIRLAMTYLEKDKH